MNIDLIDTLYFIGFALMASGIYLWFGLPQTLTAAGVTLLITALIGSTK